MKKYSRFLGIILVMVAALSGCASPQPVPDSKAKPQNQVSTNVISKADPKPTDTPTQSEQKPIETMLVKIYFGNVSLNANKVFECNESFPVEREIPKTQAVGLASINELLKGPTTAEKTKGYTTNINPGVIVQKLTIENSVAKIDFNEQLQYQVGGSCRITAIRDQIKQTLKQFSTIKDVIISIDGQVEDILQP